MLQHHNRGQKQRSRVCEIFSSNIRRGTVDGLENGALVADVAGGCQPKTADEAGAQIRKNVAVEIGHDQEDVGVEVGVGGHLEESQWGRTEQLERGLYTFKQALSRSSASNSI